MAANPLFTGTISNSRQPSIYTSSNANILRQTNLNLGHGAPRGTSTPLRKKPRLVCPPDKVTTMNESDPFQDDMIIDDDFLNACELAESQATQSHAAPKVAKLAEVSKNVERKMSNNNVSRRPHSTPLPCADGASTSAGPTGSKFTFKPSHRSAQPFNKQTNVNYTASQNSKVYYQPPSPTLSGGGTPPKTNSQNRSRNNSDSSRSRNNSGTGTPVKLQEPPNPQSLEQRLHKVQSNVVLPPTSSVQRTTNHTQFKSSSASTKPTWTSGTIIGQQQGQSGISKNQQQHEYQSQSVGRMQTHLTPPAGSVATRESPDLPTATQEGRASQKPSLYQQQLEKMRLELEASQTQLKALKDERYSKDGEIKVLRQNLAKSKSEFSKLHVEKVQVEEKFKTHQSSKEKDLAKEVEHIRTELEFKNVELREAQDSYRNLEQKRQIPDASSPFPASSQVTPSQVTPPRRSLRVALGSSQAKMDRSPRGGDIFPTQESFMEHSFSATSKSPKMKAVPGGQRSSPRRMPVLTSPVKLAIDPPTSQTFTPAPALCGTPKKKPSSSFTAGPVLCTRLQKGQSTGTQVLGKLLETSTKKNPVEGDGEAYGRGLLNLFIADDTVNPALMSSERTPGKLSPTQTRKRSSPSSISPVSTTPLQQPYNENEDLAMRSLHAILNPPHTSDEHQPHQITSDSLLGLLPLIEERLGQYLQAVQNLSSSCNSVPSSANPSASSTNSSMECSGDSTTSSCAEEHLKYASTEMSALSCLQSLRLMVCHSDDVCRTILSAPSSGVVKDESFNQADVSIIEIDPSAPLIDPTQVPGKLDIATSVSYCSKLQLVNKLIRLVCIQQPQLVWGCSGGSIVEGTLSVLAPLAMKAHIAELDRFRLLLINDSLSINLLSDSTLEKACHTLDIMAGLSKSYDLLKRFCNQSDDCQLLHVYQCGLRCIKRCSDLQATVITSKVIDLLITIVNTHNSGATFLLETDCQCSMEVIEAVLFMLHREHRVYSLHNRPNSFALLRQGVMLLHSLMTCADHKLDMEYIQLIICLVRLFRKHPDTAEAEANLLLDLWDYEDDEEEDQQQEMEVDA